MSNPAERPDIHRIQPGVDDESARTSKLAGDGMRADENLSADAAAGAPGAADAARGARRGLWVAVGAAIAVIAVVVFALLVPLTPALAWIGIAVQVALVIMLVVSAFALPPGGYRGSRFAWIVGFQAAAAVALLLLILIVVWVG